MVTLFRIIRKYDDDCVEKWVRARFFVVSSIFSSQLCKSLSFDEFMRKTWIQYLIQLFYISFYSVLVFGYCFAFNVKCLSFPCFFNNVRLFLVFVSWVLIIDRIVSTKITDHFCTVSILFRCYLKMNTSPSETLRLKNAFEFFSLFLTLLILYLHVGFCSNKLYDYWVMFGASYVATFYCIIVDTFF